MIYDRPTRMYIPIRYSICADNGAIVASFGGDLIIYLNGASFVVKNPDLMDTHINTLRIGPSVDTGELLDSKAIDVVKKKIGEWMESTKEEI